MTGTLLGSFFQYVLLRVFSRSHYKSGSFLLSSLASCGSQGEAAPAYVFKYRSQPFDSIISYSYYFVSILL